jgi:hypothetical protein
MEQSSPNAIRLFLSFFLKGLYTPSYSYIIEDFDDFVRAKSRLKQESLLPFVILLFFYIKDTKRLNNGDTL